MQTALVRMAEGCRLEHFVTAAPWAQSVDALNRCVSSFPAVDELFSNARPQQAGRPTMQEVMAAVSRGALPPVQVMRPERTLGWVAPGSTHSHGFFNGRALLQMGVERWVKYYLDGAGRVLVWNRRLSRWSEFRVAEEGCEKLTECLRHLVW